MRSLKAISLLLDYPTEELLDARKELIRIFREDPYLSQEHKAELIAFVDQLGTSDLLDVQEAYVGTFDRGRATSLLLFEHVHGESRDRGQAMVDLMGRYEEAGYVIDARELPDYIPLFLEFLSSRPEQEIAQWLGDVSHILAMLSARLQQRDSRYHVLFDALLSLVQVELDMDQLKATAANEERDDTPQAMDKIWEEEQVRFMEGSAHDCASNSAIAQRRRETEGVMAVRFVDATDLQSSKATVGS